MIVERSPPSRPVQRATVAEESPHQLGSLHSAQTSPSVQPNNISTSHQDLQRQLGQALAKDAHTQAALAELEHEKTKLRRHLEEAEAQLALARQETDAIREREARRDLEAKQQRDKLDSVRDKAAAAELSAQNRKHRANIEHRDAKQAWKRVLEEWGDEGSRMFRIEAVLQRKDRIMAEHTAFQISCKLRRAESRLRRLTESVEEERQQASTYRSSLRESKVRIVELSEELEQSQADHRTLLDSVNDYKTDASKWKSEYEKLRSRQQAKTSPKANVAAPARSARPALDIASSEESDAKPPAPKRVKAIKREKAPTSRVTKAPSPSDPESMPEGEDKLDVKGKRKANGRSEKAPKAATKRSNASVDISRDSSLPPAAPVTSEATQSARLPVIEQATKKKVKLLHGKKKLDAWDGDTNTLGLPTGLTPVRPSASMTKPGSIMTARKGF